MGRFVVWALEEGHLEALDAHDLLFVRFDWMSKFEQRGGHAAALNSLYFPCLTRISASVLPIVS